MKMPAVVAVLAIAFAGCAADREPYRRADRIIDELAGRAISEGNVVGLVVVVARDTAVVFERGYGRADIQTDAPFTSDAVLDYFSIGKLATAVILQRLAERGALNLDAPARLYLPQADYEGYDAASDQGELNGSPMIATASPTTWRFEWMMIADKRRGGIYVPPNEPV